MNLFKIAAVLTLDKSAYDKGLNDAERSANGFGGKLGSVVKGVAGLTTAAVGAAAAGVTAIVKQSVSAYGQYEQLLGGAQLMFGDAYEQVAEKAKNAYKTVQLSQSQYLEQVSGFAVGLKNALGGDAKAAADLADRIVQAEADVVASQGITQEAVQNAFNGVMRNNFMMLDNLRLGITPTKEGMEELIATVNQWNATQGRSTDYQMGNLADMQSALVDYIEMQGLAGYASMEAGDTITGSLSSVKAAWDNLIVGIGDKNADIGQLVSDVMSQATGAVKNMLPIIQNALSGVGPMIEQLVPAAVDLVVGLITDNLPDLINAAVTTIKSIGSALSENADAVIGAVFEVLNIIVDSLTDPEGMLSIIDAGIEIILKLADGLTEALPTLLPAIVGIILSIVDKLTEPEMLENLVAAAISLIQALVDGLFGAQDRIIAMAPQIVFNLLEAIIRAAPRIVLGAVELIVQFISGIVGSFGQIVAVGAKIIQQVNDGIHQKLEDAKNWGKDLIQSFVGGITEKWNALKSKVTGIADFFKGLFGHSHPEFGPMADDYKWMPDMMDLFTQGIDKNADKLQKAAADAFNLSDAVTMPEMTYTASVTQRTTNTPERVQADSDSKFEEIMAILQQYLPQLANMKMMLDTGVLVGELTPGIDAELGMRAQYAKRGATV